MLLCCCCFVSYDRVLRVGIVDRWSDWAENAVCFVPGLPQALKLVAAASDKLIAATLVRAAPDTYKLTLTIKDEGTLSLSSKISVTVTDNTGNKV